MSTAISTQFAAVSIGVLADAAAELELLDRYADDLDEHALAASTRRYYDADFRQYELRCARLGRTALPCGPTDVRLYLTDLSLRLDQDGVPAYRASSIERHLASLSYANYARGYGRRLARDPAVARMLQAIKNARQEKTQRKRPLLLDDLRRLVTSCEHDRWPLGVTAARDTFAFLLAFATAMRREEITGLRVHQVTSVPLDGLWVRLGRTKTDQQGAGAVLPVPYGQHPVTCVPCARIRWLRLVAARADRPTMMRLVRQTPGDVTHWQHVCRGEIPALADESVPLLRSVTKAGAVSDAGLSTSGLNQALKRRLVAAGYDPRAYGMHSLRAGMVTQARRNGADTRAVRRQTRHSSDAMVDLYDREWNPLDGNAVQQLGL
ncbi:tyrosine-type recombinase/integrase [Leekyejoonella antrihumi]|uniref:tyrosine-type recombinase/integrase n=1 Tax=Leekyejoonella antrihumi TaxID=1660198 RepID=UPI00164792F5|nr:tyrosine-type recombinase/integrase [Leekyejoonella antrihumi]